ncbi:MAG: cytidine deaminase, partial [Bacillota bacterium]
MQLIWTKSSNLPTASTALVADCCAVAEGLTLPCGVYVTITDDAGIREINRAERGIDRATDVLSFPTVNYPKGMTASRAAHLIKREYSGDDRAYILGEILISCEHVIAQAEAYAHTQSRELCYLLAHGIFHCFGYDHKTPAQKKEMRTMEEKALELASITRGGVRPSRPADEQLIALAKEAMRRSYSPYSRFKVGACVLSEDGRVFTGTNIENASFGLTICAERSAVFSAVSEGVREFSAIAIAAENTAPWPRGACRQVLNEFAPDIRVIVAWGNDSKDQALLSEILPHG